MTVRAFEQPQFVYLPPRVRPAPHRPARRGRALPVPEVRRASLPDSSRLPSSGPSSACRLHGLFSPMLIIIPYSPPSLKATCHSLRISASFSRQRFARSVWESRPPCNAFPRRRRTRMRKADYRLFSLTQIPGSGVFCFISMLVSRSFRIIRNFRSFRQTIGHKPRRKAQQAPFPLIGHNLR